jgi:hypothetical protein
MASNLRRRRRARPRTPRGTRRRARGRDRLRSWHATARARRRPRHPRAPESARVQLPRRPAPPRNPAITRAVRPAWRALRNRVATLLRTDYAPCRLHRRARCRKNRRNCDAPGPPRTHCALGPSAARRRSHHRLLRKSASSLLPCRCLRPGVVLGRRTLAAVHPLHCPRTQPACAVETSPLRRSARNHQPTVGVPASAVPGGRQRCGSRRHPATVASSAPRRRQPPAAGDACTRGRDFPHEEAR